MAIISFSTVEISVESSAGDAFYISNSFILNFFGVDKDAVATFYSPQTRLWELMAGSMVAFLVLQKKNFYPKLKKKTDDFLALILCKKYYKTNKQTLISLISSLGFIFLLYRFFDINKDLKFPGALALLPVTGTVLIIAAGPPQAFVNRMILSNKVLVWIGLISYPLYLWHWPLLSFAKIIEGELPSKSFRIIAIATLLAWLTYKFIERPIQSAKYSEMKAMVLAIVMLIIGCVGYDNYKNDGTVSRFDRLSPELRSDVIKIANAWNFRSYPKPDFSYNDEYYGFLKIGHNSKNSVLFVGDSHTEYYWNTIGEYYKINHFDNDADPAVMFVNLTFPPKLDPKIIADSTIRKVVLSYYWAIRYGSR